MYLGRYVAVRLKKLNYVILYLMVSLRCCLLRPMQWVIMTGLDGPCFDQLHGHILERQ